jgi:uncharacterized protein
MGVGSLSLIVKATRLCNLRCTYCHDWRTGPDQTMTFSVMARMIAAALRDLEHGAVEFIWHGGETTVLPISFYQKALLVQSRFRRPGQLIRNQIQTNGTRLSLEWVRFFRANEFGVGISLDGPPQIHDRHRLYASGRGSFQDVARGIRLLREANVRFGVLMVIDEEALAMGPDRIFDFFLEHGVRDYGFNAALPTNQPDAKPGTPTTHYTTAAQMNDFLARLYDRWCEHGDAGIKIREFEALRGRIASRDPEVCTLAGGCLGVYFLVEPNGDVAHCDLFLGDDRYTFGNICRQDFGEFRRSANMLALEEENRQSLDAMRGCPEFVVCNGWCPHQRYLSVRHNLHHRQDCCGLRRLIEHIRARMIEEPCEAVPIQVRPLLGQSIA